MYRKTYMGIRAVDLPDPTQPGVLREGVATR